MLHRPIYGFLGRFLKKYDRRKLTSKILMSDSFDYSINNASYVNSRSIIFACDIHPQSPQHHHHEDSYLGHILGGLKEYSRARPMGIPSVYVPSDQLIGFVIRVINKIDRSIILVSGDSDLSINQHTLGIHLQ